MALSVKATLSRLWGLHRKVSPAFCLQSAACAVVGWSVMHGGITITPPPATGAGVNVPSAAAPPGAVAAPDTTAAADASPSGAAATPGAISPNALAPPGASAAPDAAEGAAAPRGTSRAAAARTIAAL